MKQCGSAWALSLPEPQSLEEFLAQPRTGAAWLADAEGESLPRLDPAEPVTVAIGPEGGFTESESNGVPARRVPSGLTRSLHHAFRDGRSGCAGGSVASSSGRRTHG